MTFLAATRTSVLSDLNAIARYFLSFFWWFCLPDFWLFEVVVGHTVLIELESI